jgi:hypothetical protein
MIASLVIGISSALILLVFVAAFHVLRPRFERIVHYWRVRIAQTTEEERTFAGLWAASVVLLLDVLIVAAR